MNTFTKLLSGQAGASKIALAVAVGVVGYLVLAGSWATALFDLIGRFEAKLPL